ncbi:MAG: DNA repair protein RecN [Gammaproteobacteria bacterium]|nr:DNA repair protein RecN [Gammaproteobacteria bacterium]
MLTQIHIRNLATIEELELQLSPGSTVITGETGAGKSIFIEAIELALGARASGNLIRTGKDKLEIALSFDVKLFPNVITLLNNADLLLDTHECIIRRVITSDGRSRSYVNGTPQPLQLVKDLGEMLFHLHSQHEQQVLLRADAQRDILDRYGDLLPIAQDVKHAAEQQRDLIKQMEVLTAQQTNQHLRRDYLQFQLQELSALHISPEAWAKLEIDHKRLSHTEELIRDLQGSLVFLSQDDGAILSKLSDLKKLMEQIIRFQPIALQWVQSIDTALICLTDLENELNHALNDCEANPKELERVELQISRIHDLSRKHKTAPQNLMRLAAEMNEELNLLINSDSKLQQLKDACDVVEKDYIKRASQLSTKRRQAALRLEKEITNTIRSLSLPHAEFKILFEEDQESFSQHGLEKIIFLIKTNPDQTLQPLSKVISGGELSRLSLAAHLALAEKTSIPTLVFDEVDTGLSGAAAHQIGQLLRRLGEGFQVFCITHQAQVASFGHHHLLVEKRFIDTRTHTHLRFLNNEEKTAEIARMLGGEKITSKTLAHAKELLYGM